MLSLTIIGAYNSSQCYMPKTWQYKIHLKKSVPDGNVKTVASRFESILNQIHTLILFNQLKNILLRISRTKQINLSTYYINIDKNLSESISSSLMKM